MTYSEAFEIAERVIDLRQRLCGVRYPEGAARMAALAACEGVGSREIIKRASDALVAIERPLHTNPAWDGSIA